VPPRTAFHFVVCRAASNAKENWDFGFKKTGWPSGRGCRLFSNQADTDPFNFDNIAKQRNLNDKGKLRLLSVRVLRGEHRGAESADPCFRSSRRGRVERSMCDVTQDPYWARIPSAATTACARVECLPRRDDAALHMAEACALGWGDVAKSIKPKQGM
jgi:hypothetical protein